MRWNTVIDLASASERPKCSLHKAILRLNAIFPAISVPVKKIIFNEDLY